MTTVLAWNHHVERTADALARLRRRHEPESYDRLLADRAASELEWLDLLVQPTAADLVRAGMDVDRALETVYAHSDALRGRIGGRP